MTTAAGTIRPSNILVIGAGIAGLQAIATCNRLGARVTGIDASEKNIKISRKTTKIHQPKSE